MRPKPQVVLVALACLASAVTAGGVSLSSSKSLAIRAAVPAEVESLGDAPARSVARPELNDWRDMDLALGAVEAPATAWRCRGRAS